MLTSRSKIALEFVRSVSNLSVSYSIGLFCYSPFSGGWAKNLYIYCSGERRAEAPEPLISISVRIVS
ncbi:hypothetical protein CN553_23455 [Bacillus cereus]|uniref:Uncharacterized protein n=1 Tax=Bacillus cereus TaxID=1396 RepID=A0A9X6U834_BACCE|nr:hypothetical protein CN553_23455 [Bacillus cereus]